MTYGKPISQMEIAAALAALGIDDSATIMRIQIWPNGSAAYPAQVEIVTSTTQGHNITSKVEVREIVAG